MVMSFFSRIICYGFFILFKSLTVIRNLKKHGISLYIKSFLSEDIIDIEMGDYYYSKDVPIGKKIAIYGFGPYGKMAVLEFFSKNKIVNVYDIKYNTFNCHISSPNEICQNEFDYIVITVIDDSSVKKILDFLGKKGINFSKIVVIKLF